MIMFLTKFKMVTAVLVVALGLIICGALCATTRSQRRRAVPPSVRWRRITPRIRLALHL